MCSLCSFSSAHGNPVALLVYLGFGCILPSLPYAHHLNPSPWYRTPPDLPVLSSLGQTHVMGVFCALWGTTTLVSLSSLTLNTGRTSGRWGCWPCSWPSAHAAVLFCHLLPIADIGLPHDPLWIEGALKCQPLCHPDGQCVVNGGGIQPWGIASSSLLLGILSSFYFLGGCPVSPSAGKDGGRSAAFGQHGQVVKTEEV